MVIVALAPHVSGQALRAYWLAALLKGAPDRATPPPI